jgi:hypothetical protein
MNTGLRRYIHIGYRNNASAGALLEEGDPNVFLGYQNSPHDHYSERLEYLGDGSITQQHEIRTLA